MFSEATTVQPPLNGANEKINWDALRSEFPILSQKVNGKDLIYFDNAATSQKPKQVVQAIEDYYFTSNANVHRGIHELSNRATSAYENSRKRTAEYLKAPSSKEIIFTRGTTESINLVALSWGLDNLKQGDRICLTQMEHHSNIVPWQMLSKRVGFKIEYVNVTDQGELDLDHYQQLIKSGLKFAAFTHVSNTLGTINPVKEMCELAADEGVVTLVDGAQSGGHMPIDVTQIGCDFYAMSGHKACAPTGIGVLYGRSELLNCMNPFQGGGEMITSVSFDEVKFNVPPHRFEAGTPNICGAAGLHAALDYLENIGLENIAAHDSELCAYAYELYSQIPGIRIFGPSHARGPVISFNVDGVHSHDLVTFADTKGLGLRSGHHCNQPLMQRLGTSSTARASFYFYNTKDEIDASFNILRSTIEFLRNA